MITGINRGKLDQAVQEEFDHLTARLRPLLSQLFDADGSVVDLSDHLADVPIATVLLWAGTTVPPGYLTCNGQAVSRSYYAALFGVIRDTYGAGDGVTTFNVPNLPPLTTLSYVLYAGT
jgi:hypothetical protein